jgi:hypothetical protein
MNGRVSQVEALEVGGMAAAIFRLGAWARAKFASGPVGEAIAQVLKPRPDWLLLNR